WCRRFRRRRRSGSSRSWAPFLATATIPKTWPAGFIAGFANPRTTARACPTWKRSRARAVLCGAAANRTCTTRHSRTSKSSTKENSDASPWSAHPRMTPKQRKAKNAYERERRRLHRLHAFENSAREKGFVFVGGVDEVGRGPLAGPVVAACVVAAHPMMIRGLNDSKQVRPDLRARIAEQIRSLCAAWAVGEASVEEINRLNIYWASVLAMERAIASLPIAPDYLITDAVRIKSFDRPQEPLIKGDARCALVAAASILAKVH